MPTSIPRSAREAWGEAVADDVERWFGEALRERAVPRDEYREVLSRLDVMETRLDGLDHRMDRLGDEMNELRREMNERFDQVNERFDRANAQTNARFDTMNGRFDRLQEQMRVQTRWTIGTIALIGVILSALLAIGQFVT